MARARSRGGPPGSTRRIVATLGALGAVTAATVVPATAVAFPSSAGFTPTGASLSLGQVAAYAYWAAPVVGPGTAPSVWYGLNVGVMPAVPYGRSGFSFGGIELGVDVLHPYVYPGSPTPESFVKPVFNLKLSLLQETRWVPSIGVGAMQLAPFAIARSLSMVYVALTKSFQIGSVGLGSFTLGLAGSVSWDRAVFAGTAPFERTNLALLAAWTSPMLGPFQFTVSHIGGVSELSGTGLIASFQPVPAAALSFAVFLDNNRTAPADVVGGFLSITWEMQQLWRHAEPPATRPAPTPATPAPVVPAAGSTAPPARPAPEAISSGTP